MMSHISKGDIHAYLDGALGDYPEDAARHVREHLDACRECAQLLEVEGRLRQEASAIIGASAQGSVELDPLEELMARASASRGPERAEDPTRSSPTSGARSSAGSRLYMLRWAATVVVSLGAGWMARDLSGPEGDVTRGILTEPLATETGLRSAADQQRPERDNIDQPAEAETRESQAAVASELAEAIEPPESPGAVAVGGGGAGADRNSGRIDADAALDQIEAVAPRQRAEDVVARSVAPADVSVAAPAAEPGVQALSLSDELRGAAPAPDRRDGAAVFNDAGPSPSVSGLPSTTTFLVPGLPVRDVRVSPGADGFAGGTGGSLVVTQELGDGRVVELQFLPTTGSDAVTGGALQERNLSLGRTQPAGWAMAVREVPGGVAVLSGPLTEPELAELLDRALGLR
jgi:hypothetical protein